jgi:hypothetical protein
MTVAMMAAVWANLDGPSLIAWAAELPTAQGYAKGNNFSGVFNIRLSSFIKLFSTYARLNCHVFN